MMKSRTSLSRFFRNALFFAAFSTVGSVAFAQSGEGKVADNPYAKLGQKALMDGDFKAAVTHLEKALPSDPDNETILYALGYSQYHSNAYKGAIKSFTRVLELQPENVSAYYYRGKARNTLALTAKLGDKERAEMLQASIADYTKALELDQNDTKLYQNRALAYRDLGILLGTKSSKNFNGDLAKDAYDNSIDDLNHVLTKHPGREDMALELKKVKVYRNNIE